MLTLTVPHGVGDSLADLRARVASAWRDCNQGREVRAWREAFGVQAWVRRMEVTHGRAGWHPHLHVLVFCHHLHESKVATMRAWWAERWATAAQAVGLGAPSKEHGTHVQEADRAASYLTKMGVLEFAGDFTKHGRKLSRTPWQILADWSTHNRPADARTWQQWTTEIAGARMMGWSKFKGGVDLRAEFGHETQLVLPLAEKPAHPDLAIPADVWRSFGTIVQERLLAAYERHDLETLHAILPPTDATDATTWASDPNDPPLPPPTDGRPTLANALNEDEYAELRGWA